MSKRIQTHVRLSKAHNNKAKELAGETDTSVWIAEQCLRAAKTNADLGPPVYSKRVSNERQCIRFTQDERDAIQDYLDTSGLRKVSYLVRAIIERGGV